MNKIFIIISFLCCFQSDTPEFAWHENHKLKWTDFKSEPDATSNAAAITASGITFNYSIEKSSVRGITGFKTEVFALFIQNTLGAKKELIDDNILKHEQFHFNITELNVRYFRENISKLKVSSSITKQLDVLHKKANTDLAKMQKRYDTESNYSINSDGQQKWITFVTKELNRLEEFKSK